MSDRTDESRSAIPKRPLLARWLLAAIVVVVLILRHDYWWWDDAKPLLFGFLPVGLWWQALVTLLAAGMMWILVRFAWPAHLERQAAEGTADERR